MLFMGMMSLDGPEDYGRLSDEVLLNKVGTGDQEAFRQLYQNTDRSIYGFILSIVKNPQDAEEIMQETYIKVWTSRCGLQVPGEAAGMDVYHRQESMPHEVSQSEA